MNRRAFGMTVVGLAAAARAGVRPGSSGSQLGAVQTGSRLFEGENAHGSAHPIGCGDRGRHPGSAAGDQQEGGRGRAVQPRCPASPAARRTRSGEVLQDGGGDGSRRADSPAASEAGVPDRQIRRSRRAGRDGAARRGRRHRKRGHRQFLLSAARQQELGRRVPIPREASHRSSASTPSGGTATRSSDSRSRRCEARSTPATS